MSVRSLLLIPVCAVALCCGSSSPTSPTTERVAGAWIGNATLTSAAAGECVGPTLTPGSRDIFSARIEQRDSDLAASLTYQGNHTSCIYTGHVQDSRVTLDFSSCQTGIVESVRCSDGTLRDVVIVGGHFSAEVSSMTGLGTETTTWNVLEPGGGATLGVLTTTSQFRWNQLGLPHTDFHIFDGSILPGYVDGVTIIPEEPDPFCTKCGWF